MSKYIYICLLSIVGLISCNIKEDMSDCPGTILLDYTAYADEILDEIEPDEQVNVYIFDHSGVCCQIYPHTYAQLQEIDYEFKVPIQYNGLYAVVWHGLNSADYSSNRMKVGESYQDFYLRLNRDLARSNFTHLPSSLWASPLEPIEYCASKSRHRIHMTRIHTRINVNLRRKIDESGATQELDMSKFLLSVESQNDVYHTDYSIDAESSVVVFNNHEEVAAADYLDWGHVGTLRTTPDMRCAMQITPVARPDSPIDVGGSTEFDLVDFMLQSYTSDHRSEGISEQRFLDLNKIWNVDLLVDPNCYTAISLTINGWTIWFDDVDL